MENTSGCKASGRCWRWLSTLTSTPLAARIVAQLRMIAAIDKHQPPGVQRQRQRITLFSAERCPSSATK
ncbi:hypothetical protein LNP25_27040 [Klebsiella variicola subsp. variicola]|nr:hypothetical protein [Klebsiella variicola subsp. variicola]